MFHIYLTLAYVIPNIYVYLRINQLFIGKGYKIPYTLVYLVLFAIYPVSRNLGDSGSSFLSVIAGYLLPFYLYLWLSVVAYDLFLLLNLMFKMVSREKRKRLRYRTTMLSALMLLSVLVVIGGVINLNTIQISNYRVSVPKKKSNLDNLRVAFIADIHLLESTGLNYIEKVVNKLNSTQADIVLFGGDIVEGDSDKETSAETENAFSRIQSKYGSYGVVGNHEFYGRQQYSSFFDKAGITMLYDTIVNIDDSFLLGGRYDQHNRQRKEIEEILNAVKPDLPLIFLDHRPTQLQEVSKTPVDAQFSGHTHNGQLFPFNYIIKQMYELSWGYRKIGNTHFFVTSGLRLWGPPVKTTGKSEIMVVDFIFE
jgi:predicted MPP superfamily phosphohydrolase